MTLRSRIKVVDEIQHLYDRYDVRAVVFRDQVFTADANHTMTICEEIVRRKLKIKWLCETRADRVHRDLLKAMKAAGCRRINFGIESGDPKIFASHGKAHVRQGLEEILENVRLTERTGMFAHVFVLLGLYGENWRTVNLTIEMIKRLKPTFVGCTIATPYPGTRFFDEAKARGMLLTEDWSRFNSYEPVIRTDELSADDLRKAEHMIHAAHRKAVRYKRLWQRLRVNAERLREGTFWKHLRWKLAQPSDV